MSCNNSQYIFHVCPGNLENLGAVLGDVGSSSYEQEKAPLVKWTVIKWNFTQSVQNNTPNSLHTATTNEHFI